MYERWVNLVNKMGTLVEDIVASGIRRLARQVFDCGDLRYFATLTVRTRSDAPSREREFEALYVGTLERYDRRCADSRRGPGLSSATSNAVTLRVLRLNWPRGPAPGAAPAPSPAATAPPP